jgi:hypothetical protein
MLAIALNVMIVLALIGLAMGGVALFWIAGQDGSRTGRILGVLFFAAAILGALYMIMGRHWF